MILCSIDTYRAFNTIREQVPQDIQKLLDEFVDTGNWDGKPVIRKVKHHHAKIVWRDGVLLYELKVCFSSIDRG